jgi:uncharacterized protein
MVQLKPWQWVVLVSPIALIVGFLLVAAGSQIHTWRLNWIWAIVPLLLLGWRWLLVKWTQPGMAQVEAAIAAVNQELAADAIQTAGGTGEGNSVDQAEQVLQNILQLAQDDRPIWEDWPTFWQRCQDLVVAIAHIHHPEVKYPLLNIYVPQAYGLIRGTVDDMDQWMQKLSPALGSITLGQAYQGYEVYRKLEPSARKLMRVWGWAQWLLNPAVAVSRQASQRYANQANQQLLANMSQLLREAALRNLCRQAIALYSGNTLPESFGTVAPAPPQAQTLREILAQAEPIETVAQKPLNILLVGRTGAGKSSLINLLFQADLAAVDVLPSTDQIQNYQWQSENETLVLWDTPGYEQVNRTDLRQQVIDYAANADLLLLVTPALDPALQMDADFLKVMPADVPVITVVTQVDRLRPIREWQPPYDWQWGNRPKEVAIREAVTYRAELLACERVLPVATGEHPWGDDALSVALVEAIAPTQQVRLARFLRDLDARTLAAAKIIEHYRFQMATTQGLTMLLKSPVLQFISTVSTGSPALAYLLAQKIPVEQLPVVLGKLQMIYELFVLLNPKKNFLDFDWRSLWPLLTYNQGSPDRQAWVLGQALVEYWTKGLSLEELRSRVQS